MIRARAVSSARVSGSARRSVQSQRTENDSDGHQTQHADHAVDQHAQQRSGFLRGSLPHGIVNLHDVSACRAEKEEVEERADQIDPKGPPPSQMDALNAEQDGASVPSAAERHSRDSARRERATDSRQSAALQPSGRAWRDPRKIHQSKNSGDCNLQGCEKDALHEPKSFFQRSAAVTICSRGDEWTKFKDEKAILWEVSG